MKITKTFSVEKKLYEKFEQIVSDRNLNRSKFIESKIREFVHNNIIIDTDSLYYYKYEDECEAENANSPDSCVWKKKTQTDYVKIVETELNNEGELFVNLDDGNRLRYDLFEKAYEIAVEPQNFFTKGATPIGEQIKNSLEKVEKFKKSEDDLDSLATRVNINNDPFLGRGPEDLENSDRNFKADGFWNQSCAKTQTQSDKPQVSDLFEQPSLNADKISEAVEQFEVESTVKSIIIREIKENPDNNKYTLAKEDFGYPLTRLANRWKQKKSETVIGMFQGMFQDMLVEHNINASNKYPFEAEYLDSEIKITTPESSEYFLIIIQVGYKKDISLDNDGKSNTVAAKIVFETDDLSNQEFYVYSTEPKQLVFMLEAYLEYFRQKIHLTLDSTLEVLIPSESMDKEYKNENISDTKIGINDLSEVKDLLENIKKNIKDDLTNEDDIN